MAAPRKPQDHKKTAEETRLEPFEFAHDGTTYQLESADTLDVGFARRNRHKSQIDQLFCVLEELADADALAAIDAMKKAEFEQFQKDFFAHSGVELGE